MKKLIYVLTISALCISGCVSNSGSYGSGFHFSNIDKIAIVDVGGKVYDVAAKDQIADLFAMELLDKGYAPIRLAQVRAKIKTIEAMNGPEDVNIPSLPQDAYANIGQILQVPAVLVVNIPYFEEEIIVTAQLFDVKDGSVLWMQKASGRTGQKARDEFSSGGNQDDFLMDPLLMFQEPPQAFEPYALMAKPGQRALSPAELEKVESVISKICRSLPAVPTKEGTRTRTRRTSDW